MKKIFLQFKKLWLSFAKIIGKINTVILLSLIYFIVIGLTALISRILNKDLLQKRRVKDIITYWQPRDPNDPTLERHKFQF